MNAIAPHSRKGASACSVLTAHAALDKKRLHYEMRAALGTTHLSIHAVNCIALRAYDSLAHRLWKLGIRLTSSASALRATGSVPSY